jgi:hypothetical protein
MAYSRRRCAVSRGVDSRDLVGRDIRVSLFKRFSLDRSISMHRVEVTRFRARSMARTRFQLSCLLAGVASTIGVTMVSPSPAAEMDATALSDRLARVHTSNHHYSLPVWYRHQILGASFQSCFCISGWKTSKSCCSRRLRYDSAGT